MERVIKFRGKSKDNGEWVYGHYTQGAPEYHYITTSEGGVWQIDPATLGQFTGLHDKNGKEIYEGDTFISERTNIKYIVVFDKGMFKGETSPVSMAWVHPGDFITHEIIGTNHNPPNYYNNNL